MRLPRLSLLPVFFAAATLAAAPASQPEVVQAVEFPYYLYPHALWERELVWLKNIGIRTVEFSIPWNFHELQAGDFDFTGRTSPRRDLVGFIKILRRLGLHAWVKPLPPVPDWPSAGAPGGAAGNAAAERVWLKQIENLLATQTARHGGPIEFVQPKSVAIDAVAPPEPVTVIPATDADALARSRQALGKGHGTLLWRGVEDALYPAGWQPAPEGVPGGLLRRGAVGLSGDERPSVAAVRRSAALLRYWPPLLRAMQPAEVRISPEAKPPEGVTIAGLSSDVADAISITAGRDHAFHGDLRIPDPVTKHSITVPNVTVPAGESLWLPVNVSLGPRGLCADCSNFSVTERLLYSTAELVALEYENGILAMEFAAPQAGEAVLQLERKPVGPYLAGGKLQEFDWDASEFRARLPIPAGTGADYRVRIGIAIEEPENSAFFEEAHRLVIGQKNPVTTTYSSPAVAARSRLRLPEGYTADSEVKAPNEIDYRVAVPADAVHGDFANLTLEADGMPLGRARLQLFRPVSVRLLEAMQIHFGQHTELTPDPPTAPAETRSGAELTISLRNNWPSIQTYRVEASGTGLTFFPPKTEVSIGAMEERQVSLRVFADEGVGGLRDWTLRVTGAGTDPMELPMRVLLLPRNQTVLWTADLDGDGVPEYILESAKARAVFSPRDGGRWMEFTAKETNTNYLPEQGALGAPGGVGVQIADNALVFTGPGWQRTVKLSGGALTIDQTTPLPADGLTGGKQNGIELTVEHPSPNRAVYTLH